MAEPLTGAIVLTGLAPVANVTHSAAPSAGAVTFTGQAPTSVQPELGAFASVSLLRRTATGEASAGSVGVGAVEFEERTVQGLGPDVSAPEREALTASGVGLTGTVARGAVRFRRRTASGTPILTNLATGTVHFQERTATGRGLNDTTGRGLTTFQRRRASGYGLAGAVGNGVAVFKKRDVDAQGGPDSVGEGAVTRPYLRAVGFSEPTLPDTFRTWTMNTANEALTEYTNFSHNSYAVFNGKLYAAGPEGLYAIEGNDDNGTNIDWVIRTGFMDDKKVQLKQLRELVMGVKFNAPVRVRVWTDDETYYDYTLANYREDVVHQVRLLTGRGMRSRYYRVEFSGMNGCAFEIDSLQVPMEPVARRAG